MTEKYNHDNHHRTSKTKRTQGKTRNNPSTLVPFRSVVLGLSNHDCRILDPFQHNPLCFHSMHIAFTCNMTCVMIISMFSCGVLHFIFLLGFSVPTLSGGIMRTNWRPQCLACCCVVSCDHEGRNARERRCDCLPKQSKDFPSSLLHSTT